MRDTDVSEEKDDLTIAYMAGSASRNDEIRKLEQERDQLQSELERYSMSAGAADQFRAEAFAMRQALGFDRYGDDIAPIDLLNALTMRDTQVIDEMLLNLQNQFFFIALSNEDGDVVISVSELEDYVNQLRQKPQEAE